MARASTYNKNTAKQICDYIVIGKSVRTISKMEGMPSQDTIFQWLNKYPEFTEQYVRAREAKADYMAEELDEIASNETIPVDRAKLMIETKKWQMSRMQPKKYGDKLEVDNKGEIGLNITVKKYTLDDKTS